MHFPEPLLARLLEPADDLSQFDSGEQSLDEFLRDFALAAHKSGGPRTYVAVDDDGTVVGHYSIVSGSLCRADAPQRMSAGMGKYPIPTTLIARFAVDRRRQGEGVGSDLLLHALVTAVRGADVIGSRAVEVNVLKDGLQGFYPQYGFKSIDPDRRPLDMYVLMKDVRRTLRGFGIVQ